MSRERLLFAGVLAVLALWLFAIRAPVQAAGAVKTGVQPLDPLPVKAVDRLGTTLKTPDPGVFTVVTNESPHPRPPLPLGETRDLPNIWPPTAYSLSLSRLARLRRPVAAPVAGEATIELPALEQEEASDRPSGPGVDRRDTWKALGRDGRGLITGIKARGPFLREPKELPPPGPVEKGSFLHLLALLELDPGAAQAEGVSQIEVATELDGKLTGKVTYDYPSDIDGIEIAVEGRQRSWFRGLKEYLQTEQGGYDRRQSKGVTLLEDGVAAGDRTLIQWARVFLENARSRVPEAAKDILRGVLLHELEAASHLNEQERVLALAFHHLHRFPQEDEVLEFVGNVLASRSFRLPGMAESWFARASSPYSQLRRAEVLIGMGRFEEAHAIVEAGRTGAGARTDLLRARIALALGDLDGARQRAQAHAGGRDAAEANQILGGVAYAEGDAAKAEEHFLEAVRREPRRSTAYSDLGLALVARGKAADAMLCFGRAAALDFENTVVPRIGEALLKLAAGDAAAAEGILKALEDDNPADLLVRYYAGYARERGGDLAAAAKAYRSVLDEDHRYRIAIGRLGVVQSRRVEAGSDAGLAKEAVAHLQKAVALDPEDPLLPYILGRFLMSQDTLPGLARQLLEQASRLKAPPSDPDLPLWAAAAQAALLYRDDAVEELKVKSVFNRVLTDVKDHVRRTGDVRDVEKHPVHAYCRACLDVVQENENKVDVTWAFRTQPRDWTVHQKDPMRIHFRKETGIEFQGTVNFQGQERDDANILEFCAVEYSDKGLTGTTFYEVAFRGEVPQGALVDFGLGIVNKAAGGGRKRGPTGLQVRRKQNTGTIEVRLDGGLHPLFKDTKGREFIEMTKVPWPEGPFQVRFVVTNPAEGDCAVFLQAGDRPEVNVFQAQFGQASDKCRIFGRGGGSRQASLFAWVEGNDGDQYGKIHLNKVTLTKAK